MSTVVIHNRPSILGRLFWMAVIGVGGYFLAEAVHCESVYGALWETVKETIPALLDGFRVTLDAIRNAAGK
ncbi:hypothetical protein [Pseudarthrobacter phenanthrenivorans]|uniref:Uncharacterized protein n=1 Tax=Pseudarthrobacter phenanthrenivorans TaxID=361575 RepID=A0A0B4D5S0_PSEPS|nr:hypothetical protein [Pseudarthrobacter phenanthrenivorans]KIC68699.1 hypothetical protein RM50_04360 [Pseudarthrobacter phenanthrenivorans]